MVKKKEFTSVGACLGSKLDRSGWALGRDRCLEERGPSLAMSQPLAGLAGVAAAGVFCVEMRPPLTGVGRMIELRRPENRVLMALSKMVVQMQDRGQDPGQREA
jgi:hypothetical protein